MRIAIPFGGLLLVKYQAMKLKWNFKECTNVLRPTAKLNSENQGRMLCSRRRGNIPGTIKVQIIDLEFKFATYPKHVLFAIPTWTALLVRHRSHGDHALRPESEVTSTGQEPRIS
jgi:hypothetical protein